MAPVVVFSQDGSPPDYDGLTSPKVRFAIVPFEEAARSFRDSAMELAIIDCGEDTGVGLRILEEIKRRRCDVPVIFITAASSEDVVLLAFKLGAREYFRKPFPPDELAAAVTKLLAFTRPGHLPGSPGETELQPLLRCPASLPERLQGVVTHIEQDLAATHRLEELASRACMSKYHFCRLFKRHVGLSPKQYCLCRRMEEACKLLCRPDHSITTTALRLGFNDTTEFIRQFKKFTGLTPSAYRKTHGQSPSAR